MTSPDVLEATTTSRDSQVAVSPEVGEYVNQVLAGLRYKLRGRQKRFMGRFFAGLEVARSRGEVVGWFCLTESDEALAAKLSWGWASNRFFTRFRRLYPKAAYVWIEHRQGTPSKVTGERRRNVHVVYRNDAPVVPLAIAQEWQKVYLSSARQIEVLNGQRLGRTVRYLAGYLSGVAAEADFASEKFVRARFSNDWVFDASVRYYRDFKRVFHQAPERGRMVSMANLPAEEREREIDVLGRGYERWKREVDNDFEREWRSYNDAPYCDPERLIENWGRL